MKALDKILNENKPASLYQIMDIRLASRQTNRLRILTVIAPISKAA